MAEYIERAKVDDFLVDMETLALYEDSIPAIKNARRLLDAIPAADVICARKLTPEAKHIIETLPEAVNLLAKKLNDALYELLINGAKEDTPTGILAARADKEGGTDNG